MEKKRRIECMNCGGLGHIFRHCPKPIQSFGVACFVRNRQLKCPKADSNPDDWLCICIRRRHTYSYVDYIRGKYFVNDPKYQISLLQRMTQEEQMNVAIQGFETMWENLWMEETFPEHIVQSRRFKNNAKYKHNIIQEKWFAGGKPHEAVISKWKVAEWGLPKGRRNQTEGNIEVALRECSEETGIPIDEIKLLSTNPDDMICENYVANNGHHYNNFYAIAKWNGGNKLLDLEEIKKNNQHKYCFCAEIATVEAFTLTDILTHVRHYEKWKHTLFRKCFSVIHIKEQQDAKTDSGRT